MRIDIHRYDDWAVAYRDGKMVQQGHSLSAEALLDALGFEVHSSYIQRDNEILQDPIPHEIEIPCA